MTESDKSAPERTSIAAYQTPAEAEESFLALVRALRAIRSAGAAGDRSARAIRRERLERGTSARPAP